MNTFFILTGYFIVALFIISMIILLISQQKESIIHKKGIYPEDMNIYLRASGLKIKELLRVQESIDDVDIKLKIGQAIYLRKLGFKLLIAVPAFWMVLIIIKMLAE